MDVMCFDYSECTSNIDSIESLHWCFSAILDAYRGRSVVADFENKRCVFEVMHRIEQMCYGWSELEKNKDQVGFPDFFSIN